MTTTAVIPVILSGEQAQQGVLFPDFFPEASTETEPTPKSKPPKVNPCLALYGAGPAGQTCKGCTHLVPNAYSSVRVYWKCEMRSPRLRDRRGQSTDHRLRWPACGKYEREQEHRS